MKQLNQYIIEKFKISKDIKNISLSDKYLPTDEDYKIISNIFDSTFRKSGYSYYAVEELVKGCRNKISCIRLWIGIMLCTKSKPYIYENSIHSYPGNYGISLINKAINKFGADISDIIDIYDECKKEEKKGIPKDLEESYNSKIEGILNQYFDTYTRNGFKYTIDLVYNNCSKEAKDILNMNRLHMDDVVVLPYILEYSKSNKILKCEVVYRGSANLLYTLNHRAEKTSSRFIDKIKEEFGL